MSAPRNKPTPISDKTWNRVFGKWKKPKAQRPPKVKDAHAVRNVLRSINDSGKHGG